LTVIGGVAIYDVPVYLLSDSGELKVQLVLEHEDNRVWKSSIKRYTNLESINATDIIPAIPVGRKAILKNGIYDVTQYEEVEVNVPSTVAKIPLQTKTVTGNGVVRADDGYVGLSKVIVDVHSVGDMYDESIKITENGEYLISAKGGYDGLSSVSITVAIEEYDGSIAVV
jgi:hypothetical protein